MFGLLFSRNTKKTHTGQSTLQVFFYFITKETNYKPSKAASVKNLSSSVRVLGTTCFDECFLFHLITESYSFVKVSRYFKILWTRVERSPYFTFSPQYQCSAINTKVSKWSYRILYLINFRNLFYGYLFFLWLCHTFLYKWIFFEKLKHVFYIKEFL